MSEEPDIALFIEALQQYGGVRVSADGPYTARDRYYDFHGLFSSEQGRRVLAQISDLCELNMPDERTASHPELAAYVARKRVGMTIAAWATVPPREQPVQPAKK